MGLALRCLLLDHAGILLQHSSTAAEPADSTGLLGEGCPGTLTNACEEGRRELVKYLERYGYPASGASAGALLAMADDLLGRAARAVFEQTSAALRMTLASTNGTMIGPVVVPDQGYIYRGLQESFRTATYDRSLLSRAPGEPWIAFAMSPGVRENAIREGTMFYINSRDYALGSVLLQSNATFRGQSGIVEYIMPLSASWYFLGRSTINHARFIRGAPVSGVPNNFDGRHPPFQDCHPPACI